MKYDVVALRELRNYTGGVLSDGSANTTLAYVKNAADGERVFAFPEAGCRHAAEGGGGRRGAR